MRHVGVLLTVALVGCADSVPPGAPEMKGPPTPPAPIDLRFKAVGSATSTLRVMSGLAPGSVQIHAGLGTPLEITPCAPPASLPSCYWLFGLSDAPDGMSVSTVYYSTEESLSRLESDLSDLQRWAFTPFPSPGQDYNSVITSLMIDEPSRVYATSGLQSSQMHEYDLAWGSVAPNALQAAASQAGVRGRVITAVAFKGGRALYLSYGWTRAATAEYEAKVVPTKFDDVTVNAAKLEGEGYIITALGGDDSEGFLLVGTRLSGQTAPRRLEIATDSAVSVLVDPPQARLARNGYAIVGGILGHNEGASRQFTVVIGEK